jgi:2-C-methyl-D-erythritol 4-phosphate cytidylyltransferase
MEGPLLHASAIVVAAGSSARMHRSGPPGARKPLLRLGDRTVLEHACAALAAPAAVRELVLVVHPGDLEAVRALVRASPDLAKVRAVVEGGERRGDSVRAGVLAASPEADVLAVHDAARPLVEVEVVEEVLAVAEREGAALVAVPVHDTLKRAPRGTHSEATLDRSTLWAAQTPQAFRAPLLRELLERARAEGFQATDEAALHERYVGPCPIVRGDSTNLKVTTPADLAVAAAILEQRAATRGAR